MHCEELEGLIGYRDIVVSWVGHHRDSRAPLRRSNYRRVQGAAVSAQFSSYRPDMQF